MENTARMVIEKNYFLFKTLRVILDDERLWPALKEKKHAYVTGLSYNYNSRLLSECGLDCNAKQKDKVDKQR